MTTTSSATDHSTDDPFPDDELVSATTESPSDLESTTDVVFDSHRLLTDPHDLDDRVRQLIPCAIRRQLWVILLDEDDLQIPVMVPIGELPLRRREGDDEGLGDMLTLLSEEYGAAAFVFVVERTGSSRLRDSDRNWLEFLSDLGVGRRFEVRAAYLSHDTGTVRYRPGRDVADRSAVATTLGSEDAA